MDAYAAIFVLGLVSICQSAKSAVRDFPPGFKFGAGGAAYQVEGAWNVSDKGESVWDRASHTPGFIEGGETGDVATDSYHLFRRDVEMVKEMGLDYYRLSISWPRLLPNGFTNHVSEDGKRYYTELIDELLKHNIQPMVTIFHWDLPIKLQELGGWTNPLIVGWMADYARVVLDLFADKVKLWVTINEPLMFCGSAYGKNAFGSPTGISSPGIGDYICVKNALLAHATVYRMFEKEYKPKHGGIMSLANQILWFVPETEADKEVVEEVNAFYTGLFVHPIFSAKGGWPSIVERIVAANSQREGFPRSRLPTLTPEEIQLIKGSYDYFGLNHYTTKYAKRSNSTGWALMPEVGADAYADPKWPASNYFWLQIVPEGMRQVLVALKQTCQNPQIIITECGWSSDPGLVDKQRVLYYKLYLNEILNAIYLDGVNVTHFTAWSLMDNLEWNFGYKQRFGLYEVDFSDPALTRTPRMSALVLKHIAGTHTLDMDYEPPTLNITQLDTDLRADKGNVAEVANNEV